MEDYRTVSTTPGSPVWLVTFEEPPHGTGDEGARIGPNKDRLGFTDGTVGGRVLDSH